MLENESWQENGQEIWKYQHDNNVTDESINEKLYVHID